MKIKGHESCPCGSGKSLKKCCKNAFKDPNNKRPKNQVVEPTIFYGYNRERTENELSFEIPREGLVCMVSDITSVNFDDVNRQYADRFKLGDWFMSAGSCNGIDMYGPFETMEQGFEKAREEVSAVRFMKSPTFNI